MTAHQSMSFGHPEIRGLSFHVFITLLGLAGIVSLFLPFTNDESPVSAVAGRDFWRLALPFFLSVLISLTSLRWIIVGRLSRFEMAVGYFASVGVACLTLTLYFQKISPAGVRDWASLSAPPVTFVLGGLLVARQWRKGLSNSLNTLVCLQVAYLANCLLCLTAFFGEWQIGAYFALVTALVYLTQIIVAFREAGRSGAAPSTPTASVSSDYL